MIVRLDPTKDAGTIRQLGMEDDPEPEALVLSVGEGLSPHRDAIRVTDAEVLKLREEVERLRSALRGLLREEPNIYEGRLEASLYVTVDALEEARAVLSGAAE